ncbi:MAG: M28 family peptidase [Candidatus Eisenbacteria bacterium]
MRIDRLGTFGRIVLLVIVLTSTTGMVAASQATAARDASPALQAASPSHALVSWQSSSSPDDPSWLYLHGFDGSTLGLLPAGSPLSADPAAQSLGLYDEDALYFLISRGAWETLQSGALPPSWQGTFDRLRTESPDRDLQFPSPETLRSIDAPAGDDAQVLVRLPESLSWVQEEPGCRAQRLRVPAAAAGRDLLLAPPLLSTQPTTYWQALKSAVSEDRLFDDLDYLSTTLQTRHSFTSQMGLACEYVKNEFEALGLTAYYDPFTYLGHPIKNVVGVKTGTVDPSRIYILCGHLDSTSPQSSTLAPGAEDNGSGSAAVLEAARLLAPVATDYTIYFICFTAEEQGLVGSEHFAAAADQQNLDIRGVLNLDMVAYYKAGGSDLWLEGFRYGTSSTWLLDLVQSNAQTYTNLVIYRYSGEGWGSDHESFHDHGFSAILSIDADWEDYSCYHQTCDTPSRLNGPLWRKITAANLVTLGQLAGAQGSTGQLSGTVAILDDSDPSGATINLSGTTYAQQVCGTSGAFAWADVFPGDYTLIAEKTGCIPDTTELTISSGGVEVLDITLLPVGWAGVDRDPDARDRSFVPTLSISPSPMTAGTAILLHLPGVSSGDLWVYGPDGRRVARLRSGGVADGALSFQWNGRDAAGHRVPAGLYWLRWQGGGREARGSVAVIR